MNPRILQPDVQDFLKANLELDLSKFAFQESPFDGVTSGEIINQIQGKNYSNKKLPTWSNTENIYFPIKLSLEQSSSEKTALYKASLFQGEAFIDISGGMGVDASFFAKKLKQGTHCEINESLSQITASNFKALGISNVNFYVGDGLQYVLDSKEKYNLIYIDPSRRKENNSRTFILEDTEPNIRNVIPELVQKAEVVVIKTSPLIDLKLGLKDLKKVTEVHVVSVKNEVKELLWFLSETGTSKNCRIHAVDIQEDRTDVLTFSKGEEADIELEFEEIKKYLYEPNRAILKAGAFKLFAKKYGVGKLHSHSHLYTSEDLKVIPSRTFEVEEILDYSKKELKKRFGKTRMHILKRNYPESVANIRKKTGILEGGTQFLIFTTDQNDNRVVVLATPLFDV